MWRRIRKLFRLGLMFCLIMVVSVMAVFAISTTPKWGDALLKIEVQSNHGDEVYVSVPLSVVKTAFKIMPRKIRNLCRDLELTPEMITDELKTMPGEDLVRITGEDNVRIYVEPVSMDSTVEQGFVTVHVKEGGHDGNTVNVWVPRGLVSLAGTIVRISGVVDRYVELPPEIENLRVVNKLEM